MQKQYSFLILVFLALFFQNTLEAQELSMKVVRCTQVDRDQPVRNIFVDANNIKWVGYAGGMYELKACDLAEKTTYPSGKKGVASLRSGNSTVKFSMDELQKLVKVNLGRDNTITAAYYNEEDDELWLGTQDSGVLKMKTFPNLALLEEIHSSNSRLKSNRIESLFIDGQGVVYIGTDEGILRGKGSKWEWEKNLYNVKRILEQGRDIWILADGDIWVAKNGKGFENYRPYEAAVEGEILDFTFDSDGFLYLVSQSIAKCDIKADSFEIYGQFQDYLSQYATCVAADKDGGIWVGTRDKGVYFLEKNSAITVNIIAENEPTCTKPNNKANLSVKIYGGTEPFTYVWDKDLKGEKPNNVGIGVYTLKITDAEGRKKEAKIEIADPSISLTFNALADESGPNKGDGKAEVVAKGGKPDYAYVWDNGEKTAAAKKLSEGEHSVTVTDRNSCTATGSVNLSAKSAPMAVILQIEIPISCADKGKASLDLKVTGGKAPFSYKWSVPEIQGTKPSNLVAGSYTATITDAEGTTKTATILIPAPESITKNIEVEKPASTGNSDGQATVKAKGGTGAFSYAWDNGETSQTAKKLAPGKHSVTITDGNGCTTTAETSISENILELQASIDVDGEVKCAGDKSANVSVNVSGGKAPFTYKWSAASLNGAKASNVAAGTYALTITDAAGSTKVVSISVKENAPIELSLSVEASASQGQSDGKAEIKASGGAGSFSYIWDTGETKSKSKALSSGSHSVTVTDKNGCEAVANIEITENILPLAAKATVESDIKCSDAATGSLVVQVSGGKSPFTYKWNKNEATGENPKNLASGAYEVTVTDAAGSTQVAKVSLKAAEKIEVTTSVDAAASTGNSDGQAEVKAKGGAGSFTYAWENGETKATAKALAPGAHSVTVTDANGCKATSSVSINENILPLQASLEAIAEINCAGEKTGKLLVKAKGGKAPFSYKWNKNELKGESPENLASGVYEVTVTDAAGSSQVAKVSLKAPEKLEVSIRVDAPASTGNADGKATLTLKGGTGDKKIEWDNGETGISAQKLGPGKRIVTVSDANNCTASATVDISENILPLQVTIKETQSVVCNGDPTGAITLTTTGGKAPYQYKWSSPYVKGETATTLPAGTYKLTLTDAEGTEKSASITLKEPDALRASVSKRVGALNENAKDGKVLLLIEGGTAPYAYIWDNGETTVEATKLAVGSHTATITDANQCKATITCQIKAKILPDLTPGLLSSGEAVRMESLLFDADSTNFREESLPVLDEVYEFLIDNPNIVIEVGGHTNNVPPDEYCDRLSGERAKSVADYVIGKGVDPKRVFYKGYGKRKPFTTNETALGRKKNQRVEVRVLKVDFKE